MRIRPLVLALGLLIPALAAAPPNIVIFLADDQGWGDLGFNGNSDLSTPHIDSIAKQGASIDRFFVCPVCAPTRSEFLTGRHSARTGVRGVTRGEERMDADEQTIADVFKRAGYTTGAFGKWHNGSQAPYHPNSRGFDEFYGFTAGHWGHYFSPNLEHNDQVVKGDGYVTDDFTNHAIDFIEKHKDAPFLCYLPYCTPHSPMQVPDEYWNRFKDKTPKAGEKPSKKQHGLDHYRAALAMVENIDWNVGRVLERLDELELTNNTIVIYFSDNGPNGARWNGGMRGRKGSLWDGGVRSPFHIRWPAKIQPGRRVSQNCGAIDLLPTLASAAGIKLDSPKPLDGKDISPLLLGEAVDWPDRLVFGTKGFGPKAAWAVRNQRYRFYSDGELHDITADPGQQNNIAADHPKIVKMMKAAGEAYSAEVAATQIKPDPRPFPVGVAATTHLPARDGRGSDGVKWSSRHPNCSFFTGWNSTKQSIVWPVEITRADDYEATVFYTCPQQDLGSTIELSCGDAKTAAKITKAFDPPLQGASDDRSKRSESYYKDFTPLSLGTLALPEGPADLTLRALDIPGKSVADIRWLVLRRK